MKTRQDNDMIDCTGAVWVPFAMKTRQDNDVIDHIGAIYIETILNFRDWSDWVLTVMKTRKDNYVMIVQMRFTPKTKLSCHDRLERV